MTTFRPSVEFQFDVGHDHVELLESCSLDGHGHNIRVRVSLLGAYDPQVGHSYKLDELERDVASIVDELRGRNLSKMMPGAQPTAEGLGLWMLERLLNAHPKIVEVIVWLDHRHRYSLMREPL